MGRLTVQMQRDFYQTLVDSGTLVLYASLGRQPIPVYVLIKHDERREEATGMVYQDERISVEIGNDPSYTAPDGTLLGGIRRPRYNAYDPADCDTLILGSDTGDDRFILTGNKIQNCDHGGWILEFARVKPMTAGTSANQLLKMRTNRG